MNKMSSKLITGVLAALIVIVSIFPIYWTVLTSLRSRVQIVSAAPLYPDSFLIENYIEILINRQYYIYVINSIITATGNALLVLAIGLPAAYALTRFRLKHSRTLTFWILTNRMAPPAAFLLPVYLIFTLMGLKGTFLSLILAYTLFNIPLTIWVLIGAIEAVPRDVEEAAMLDGLSPLGVLLRITIPLARPGVITAGLLAWLFAWNHYVFGMILAGPETKQITMALGDFAVTMIGIQWEYLAVMTVATILPVLVILIFVRNEIVRGFSFGRI